MLAGMADRPVFHLRDLDRASAAERDAVAALLVAGFRAHWPDAWPTLEEARGDVLEMCAPERLARVAVDATGAIIGFIGGLPGYGGRVWELHPLVVREDARRRGVGRALVADLERLVAARGALTLQLGSDDEDDMTSLGGADLYDDLWARIRDIQDRKGHPFAFYRKLGYTIIGVIPDANGRGKPDILMARRIG